MNSGVPPTAPNARAGLFTPPGIDFLARSKAAALLVRLGIKVPQSLKSRLGYARSDGPRPLHLGDDRLVLLVVVEVRHVAALEADQHARRVFLRLRLERFGERRGL